MTVAEFLAAALIFLAGYWLQPHLASAIRRLA